MKVSEKVYEVLLVEDSAGDARLVSLFLGARNYRLQLHRVVDGIEAMEFLLRQQPFAKAPRPDLILLDLNLPRKNGWEVLEEVKSSPQLKSIPVVVLSTSSMAKDVSRAYSLFANSYFVKPTEVQQFQTLLETIEDYWLAMVKLPTAGPNSTVGSIPA